MSVVRAQGDQVMSLMLCVYFGVILFPLVVFLWVLMGRMVWGILRGDFL